MPEKDLDTLSLQELWQLFPIFLVPHKKEWADWFAGEKARLQTLLADFSPAIHHIGSTSIPTIWAKNIVDILVVFPAGVSLQQARDRLLTHGYRCMADTGKAMSFNKGYTPSGFAEEVFHIHFRHPGDHDELYFRDYLLNHPEEAERYEALKQALWQQFEFNRNAYTEAKSSFVRRITEEAKTLYAGRYAGE